MAVCLDDDSKALAPAFRPSMGRGLGGIRRTKAGHAMDARWGGIAFPVFQQEDSMFQRELARAWPWMSVVLIAAMAGPAAAQKKVYVMTDLEGASGVYMFSQSRAEGPLNDKAKEYFMGDLAAVVRGLRDGGATEIVVFDGHGSSAFVPHLMEPGAKYITGPTRPFFAELDGSFAGIVQVGAHAMMGTPDGVLCHTQSSKSENRYWYNGVESGELAQVALIAGHYGVPTILVTGDEAACRESRKFFGDHCATVAVKKGLSRESAELYPFAETRKALYEGAKRAMASIPECKPYRTTLPIQAKKQWIGYDDAEKKTKMLTKEGTISDVLRLLDF
jgi:D-amino peptidase